VKHPKKYLCFLRAIENMPEKFRQNMLYPLLPSGYFHSDEVPAYLRKASLNGKVKRIGNAWWQRLDMEVS